MSPEFAERVLDLVEQIPPGKVLSYVAIAEILGEGGPRQVARVMATEGHSVPWWRVVRADGSLTSAHGVDAQVHYVEEATPMRNRGSAIDIKQALWRFEA